MPRDFDLFKARLYTFVDTAYLNGRDPADVARQLCAGGSDLIQLRAKEWPEKEVRVLAERIVQITRGAGIPLVINDFPRIAQEVGAEFCHLGQEDFFEGSYKTTNEVWAGYPQGTPQIGLSTHAPAQAERAIAAKPAYIAIGPVFATATKPTANAVTLEYVRWAAASVRIPWFAIGGIHLGNLNQILEAGATRICVVSAILNAPDIALACKKFRARLED
ncbi:MAG: thiamine-phosphate pyrophosphorylase [Verrucomicrobiales bacterium]|nr:thiamine-phosphate pyrophosphorylase [Verrucomicrobiales bacterium]